MAFEQLGVVSHFGADLHVAHSLTVVFTAIEDQEPRWTQTAFYATTPDSGPGNRDLSSGGVIA